MTFAPAKCGPGLHANWELDLDADLGDAHPTDQAAHALPPIGTEGHLERKGYVARLEGFEPPTPGSEDQCSNPLSYRRTTAAGAIVAPPHCTIGVAFCQRPSRVRAAARPARRWHPLAPAVGAGNTGPRGERFGWVARTPGGNAAGQTRARRIGPDPWASST